MNVSEVISFKTDLEKGHYISAIELIEMVESFNEGIERKDLLRFLETLNIFSIRLYSFNEYNGLIYYGHPEFDEKIGEKIADFLYLRENHVKDETHDVYASRLSHLETVCWHRVDLLRIEGFVNNTDIVNWGKPHILQHMYDGMTGEHFDIIASFTKNAQQDICKILGRTPLDNNTSGHSQAQTTQPAQDKELHKKIAELEQQLSKFQAAVPDVVTIPFGKRIDLTNKKLPPDERLKESYQIYSNDFSFHEDTHPVNTPDEMIKRIQGLLNVIKKKDNKIFKLEQQTNTPANAQAEIDKLKEQLDKANTELAAAKTTTTDQPLNWQNMSEHIYPPELHLALMIWQRIYADGELKESHPHITSHAGKFELIAKRMNLDPTRELGKRIEKITNVAYTKNGQTLLAVPLHAVKELHMPPLKEKTTL